MSEDNKSKPTPIRVAKLMIAHASAHGVRVPFPARDTTEIEHTITAEIREGLKTEIEFRPWLRHHRVARFDRVTKTENGKESVTWKLRGEFFIPETWATWAPVAE